MPKTKSRWQRLRQAWGGDIPTASTDSVSVLGKLVRLSEQVIGFPNVDAGTKFDDKFFKSLGAVSELDLPNEKLEKAQRISMLMFRQNVRAWSSIELIKDFVIGPGVRIKAVDKRAEGVIRRHWRANQWQIKLPERVRALGIFGEQVYPLTIDKPTGLVSVSSVSPFRIVGVVRDEDDPDRLSHLVVNMTKVKDSKIVPRDKKREEKWKIVQPKPDGTFDDDVGDFDRLCFFFPVNRVGGGVRGVPDLSASMDWLQGIDTFLFALLEKAAISQQVVWKLQAEGANEAKVQEIADQFVADILSGSVFATNEKVTLEVMAPDLKSGDAETVFKMMLRNIHAGTRQPGMFFGDSEDLTRAAASELAIPVGKSIEGRQNFVKDMLETIFDFQLQQAMKAKVLPPDIDPTVEVKMARIYLRDLTTATAALNDLSTSLSVAEQNEWITKKQAAEVYELGLENLGALAREDVDEDFSLPADLQNYAKAIERADSGRDNGPQNTQGSGQRGSDPVAADLPDRQA